MVLPVLLGLAAVVVLTVGGFLLGRGGGSDETSGSASTAPAPTTTSPSPPPSPARPTARGIDAFIREYLETAAADPSAGFQMLTPQFQTASDGLSGYSGFWGDVESVQVQRVRPDPSGPSVEYRYTYTLANGRTVRDDVELRLSFEDGTYKIAGEG